jgi:hypothetical protein
MTDEKVIEIFDRQIYWNSKYIVHKELFRLTKYFTLEDWNKIRTPKYWNTLDSIKDEDKKKEFTLQCVKYYLKNETRL